MCEKKVIKVLQVFASLNMGGAESRMMDVYRTIEHDKYSFDFLSQMPEPQYYEKEILEMKGKIFKIENPNNPIKNFFQILNVIKRNGPYDAVHAHTSYQCGIVMLAAKMAGVPVRISHSRTVGSNRKGVIHSIFILIGKVLIRLFATHRLAISEKAAIFLYGKKWFKCANTYVIPNAMETDRFLYVNKTKLELINALGIDINVNDIVIGHVGRFSSMKNQEFLINIMEHLIKQGINAKLIMVGDGPLKGHIEEIVKEKKLEPYVLFTGVRDDVSLWMHVFSVVVIPSTYEGLCNVAIEAQAAGCPCVFSDVLPEETNLEIGLAEYISLKETIDAWINAILISYKKEKVDVSEIEKALRKKGFDIETVTEKYCMFYRSTNS